MRAFIRLFVSLLGVVLFIAACGDDRGEIDVASTSGAIDIDISASAGRVLGTIVTNGGPEANAVIRIDGYCASCYADANGRFDISLPAGSYTARVLTAAYPEISGTSLGSFDVVVHAGETIDLGNVHLVSGVVRGTLQLLPPGTYNASYGTYQGYPNAVGTISFAIRAGETTDFGNIDPTGGSAAVPLPPFLSWWLGLALGGAGIVALGRQSRRRAFVIPSA